MTHGVKLTWKTAVALAGFLLIAVMFVMPRSVRAEDANSGEYQTEGRVQTEEEAKEVDNTVKRVLDENEIKYTTLPIDGAYSVITDFIIRELKYYTTQNLTIVNK